MKIRLQEVRQVYPASQSQMAAQIFKRSVSDVRSYIPLAVIYCTIDFFPSTDFPVELLLSDFLSFCPQ